MNIIAIDIGSSFIKSALFDMEREKILFSEKVPSPAKNHSDDSSHFEVDAEAIYDAVKNSIDKLADKAGDLKGIVFSTQQHGCVLCHPALERDTYISWQDTRCLKLIGSSDTRYINEIEAMLPESVMRVTGVPVKPALAMCNVYTLFRERGISCTDTTKIYTLGSYIIERLTGNNVCHITNAAPMGFVDLETGSWHRNILKKVGLDKAILPRIESGFAPCGQTEIHGKKVNVYPDFGDVQTSIYGSNAQAGDVIVNIATSGQLIMISDERVYGDYEVRPYYDNNYCYVTSRMPGGRNLDVVVDFLISAVRELTGAELTRKDIWDSFADAEHSDAGGMKANCGFYDLPDSLPCGAFTGIDSTNLSFRNMLKATIDNFGAQYARFLKKYKVPENGRLFMIGGAILKNAALQKAVAAAMGFDSPLLADQDEVYGGMFHLARKCILNKEGIR